MNHNENQVYKEALQFYKRSFQIIVDKIPPSWVHLDQTMRSLGSVPANIAEGYGRGEVMPKDKSQRYFQTIANGSLCEFTAWLDIAVIHNVITNVDANHLKDIAKRLSDMIIDDACKPKYLGVNL